MAMVYRLYFCCNYPSPIAGQLQATQIWSGYLFVQFYRGALKYFSVALLKVAGSKFS